MATDIQAWCREAKSENWTDDREVDALEAFLDGSLTATEAAQELTEYTDRRKASNNQVGRIWTLLQLCAVECADLHEPLVDLIKAIVACAPSKRTGGVDWTKQETSFRELWRDTEDCEFDLGTHSSNPSLVNRLYSTLIMLALHGSLQDKTEYQRASKISITQRWTNFHAFSALLCSSAIFGTDFGLVNGLVVIVAALEGKSPTSWERERDLPAALQWLVRASKHINRDARSMGSEWDSGSERWNDQAGFSLERWKFWKERVQEIQKEDAIDEEVKQLLRTAGVAMGKAERAKK